MNVCFFSIVTYWHGLRGGMDLHGKHLLEGLSERGHTIVVISTKHPSGKEYEEIKGIKIYYLNHTIFGSSRKGWKRQSINKFKDIIKTEKIDIALSQQTGGYGVAEIARRRGIPFVTIMHGYETMIFKSILNQVMNFKKDYLSLVKSFLSSLYYTIFQELPILKNSSTIIAVSDGVSKVIEKRSFIDRDNIKVINNGIDLKLFKFSGEERAETRLKLNIANHDKVVLFLSLLSKQKGTDIAIKALNELTDNNKNIKLIIAGDGEYLEEARLLVNRLNLESSVIFAGFVRNEDTVQYYNASDIFIFPTLRLESFGIVIAEAMACGKPVIASDVGCIPDVIDNGINGILIPIGDFKELARQINLLLDDPQYSTMLTQNARRKALERFGLDRMIDETIKVFESVIKLERW